jgi:hypothetical protein
MEKGQTFALKLAQGEYLIEAVKATGEPEEYYAQKKVFIADDSLQTVSEKKRKRGAWLSKERRKRANSKQQWMRAATKVVR